MNTCTTRISGGQTTWFGLSVAAPYGDGEVVVLNRPEDMVRSRTGAVARVTRIVDLGQMMKVSLITPAGDLLTWTCRRVDAPPPGSDLRMMPRRLHLYRDEVLLGTLDAATSVSDRHEART